MCVVKLTSKLPFDGALPCDIGPVSLVEVEIGPMWSVAPFAGRQADCVTALSKIGVIWPDVGRCTSLSTWFGLDQIMVFGSTVPDMPAAVIDQSDAWVCIAIKGAAVDVLARLAPVDLRATDDTVWRTQVGHMPAHITRVSADVYEVMVMRSMAQTLLHDLTRAATGIAARG